MASAGALQSQKALEDAVDRCENVGAGKRAPLAEVTALLKLCRDNKVRLPEVVAKHGLEIINDKRAKGDLKQEEYWLISEQVGPNEWRPWEVPLSPFPVFVPPSSRDCRLTPRSVPPSLSLTKR